MQSPQLDLYGSMIFIAAATSMPSAAPAQTDRPATEAPAKAKPSDQSSDIVVTGRRTDVIATPDRLSFNVANDLQVQTGTVADVLRNVPGVEVDLEGRVSLRGDPGVTILIDGRPSAAMNGESRGDVLNSMSAGQIERVEVITNPSAAFSPEGSGGVINLVSKQARRDTRTATARATIGTEGRGGLNLSGTHSGSRLTMTGDLGYRRFTSESDVTLDRSIVDSEGNFVTSRQDATVDNSSSMRNGRFVIDYDLDKKNRFSTEVSYRDGRDEDRTETFVTQNAAPAYDHVSNTDFSNRGLGLRASWRRKLPGDDHEFVADVELNRTRLLRRLDGVTTYALAAPSLFEHFDNAADRDDIGLKLDYKRPMGEGRSLNVGYEVDVGQNDFAYVGARGSSPDALSPIPGLTNEFDYDQTVHAWYGTYQFKLGKLEAQPGLRVEQVEMAIDQVTEHVHIDRDYLRAYPTLHLSYELAAKQQLRGSYSRRIQRPSPQDLNPYTVYIDPLNLRRGNPFLRPEVTDSFELSWQLRDNGTFYSVAGFYRHARGRVTDVITDLGEVFLTTRANLATDRRAGIDLIASGKLSKTLTYNASGTFQWIEIDPRQPSISAPRSMATGTIRANVTWQPTAKDYFQLNGFYSGKNLRAQGYRGSGGILNLGYRRKVSERFSIVVTGQNVLNSGTEVTVLDTPTIRYRHRRHREGRIFLLALIYNIGGQGRRQEPGFDFDQGAGGGG